MVRVNGGVVGVFIPLFCCHVSRAISWENVLSTRANQANEARIKSRWDQLGGKHEIRTITTLLTPLSLGGPLVLISWFRLGLELGSSRIPINMKLKHWDGSMDQITKFGYL